MLTLYKQGNLLYSKEKVLRGLERGFEAIHDWNACHIGDEKIKVYATVLEYLKEPSLKNEVEDLIDKYGIEFWKEDPSSLAEWGKWKMVMTNSRGRLEFHRTPYKDQADCDKAMKARPETDLERKLSTESPFSGGVFDEIKNILKEE